MKTRLCRLAEANGRSVEEEAMTVLSETLGPKAGPENLADFIQECFAPFGGTEIELLPHEPMRELPRFR